jgi:chromosomal replication initiation ATPase DnaA
MGLTAELQMPDSETRLAILRHKMAAMPDKLSDAVLGFISERVKTNIRRLEGALNRVAAFAQLHGRPITVPQTEVLLRDLLQQEGQQSVSIDLIQRRVADTYDLRLGDMTSKRRPANIALPRMVAMYLSRRLTIRLAQRDRRGLRRSRPRHGAPCQPGDRGADEGRREAAADRHLPLREAGRVAGVIAGLILPR